MSVHERRSEIVRRLHTDGYVEAKKLSENLGVDASTIRRDLDGLVRSGQAERTHGGARPVGGAVFEIPYAIKEHERRDQKVAIARLAAERVKEGDSVILDSGSTTFQVAMALRNMPDLTFITNDLRIANLVASTPGVRLFLSGGELLNSVFTLVGDRATDFFSDFSATWGFLGADAIDPVAGITNTNTVEVPTKRAMIAAAATTVVVADSTKFGTRTLARVAAVDEVQMVITDDGAEGYALDEYGARVLVAGADGRHEATDGPSRPEQTINQGSTP